MGTVACRCSTKTAAHGDQSPRGLPRLLERTSVTQGAKAVLELVKADSKNWCPEDATVSEIMTLMADATSKEILRMMKLHPGCLSVHIAGLSTLRTRLVKGDSAVEADIVKNRGLSVVILAMQEYAHDKTLQVDACWCLHRLSQTTPLAAEAISRQAPVMVIRSMHAHPDSEALQELCCAFLNNMLKINAAACRSYILSLGGDQAVMNTMKEHPCNAAVQMQACCALSLLLTDPLCPEYAASPVGIQRVLCAMNANRENVDVQIQGCLALSIFAKDHEENGENIIASCGTNTILETMKEHLSSAAVQEKACMTLRYLLACNSRALDDEDGFIEIAEGILGSMAAHPRSPIVQEHGCWTLFHIAHKSAASKPLVRELGEPTVEKAFVEYYYSRQTCKAARAALHCFTDAEPDIEQVKVRMRRLAEAQPHGTEAAESHGSTFSVYI